jgi:glycosyltransferase involved in cell wall biosynthesis
MRAGFLVAELGRSGGMQVVRGLAQHLRARGDECVLVVCGPKPGHLPETEDGVPVLTVAAARDARFDVAVATWWTTAESLFELDADRHVMFMQNIEHRFYREHERADGLGALAVLDLPADYIVVSSHLQRLLDRLRPDARTRVVPVGIDKRRFTAPHRPAVPGPLRILVEGQPTLWFKGVEDAVAAVRAMRAPASLTLVVHDPAEVPDGLADRVEGGLSPDAMAALYGEHDVLLKLSRFEGLGLPPLEAFHAGLTCVLTPFTGSEDYAEHGVNSLVVGFDDLPGTSAALDLLARDRDLRTRLSEGARATAARWPDRAAAADAFVAALRELVAEPVGQGRGAHRRMLRGRRLTIELAREEERRDATRRDHAVGAERAVSEARLAMIQDLTTRRSYRAVRRINQLLGRQVDE